MGRSCDISINYFEVNIIVNYLDTRLSLTFDNTKLNEFRRKEGVIFFVLSYYLLIQ